MSILIDVNILLACGWSHHPFHSACSEWLDSEPELALCPIVELGFIRVSMSPAFRASHEDAKAVMNSFSKTQKVSMLPCDLSPRDIPLVTSYKDTTDSYLVALAAEHGIRLATLDQKLIAKTWAKDIAFLPFSQ